MTNISYAKAINLALKESMKDNKSVFCIGEDVGFGGAYGATQNLREQFGYDRVRDTPISESAIIGFSIGSLVSSVNSEASPEIFSVSACFFEINLPRSAGMLVKVMF